MKDKELKIIWRVLEIECLGLALFKIGKHSGKWFGRWEVRLVVFEL